jgi:hypothetical protein
MRCSICRKPVDLSVANPFRPFCSERCRTIDLGKWVAGDYRIPDDSVDPDNEHPADYPPRKTSN